jgi:hypothetical protein
MFEAKIFLGFPVDAVFQKALDRSNPALRDLLTKGGEEYLEVYESQDQLFLGKTLGATADLSRIELAHANIMSLLKKLVSDYPYQPSSLVLISKHV